jgi:hypothetical protein
MVTLADTQKHITDADLQAIVVDVCGLAASDPGPARAAAWSERRSASETPAARRGAGGPADRTIASGRGFGV